MITEEFVFVLPVHAPFSIAGALAAKALTYPVELTFSPQPEMVHPAKGEQDHLEYRLGNIEDLEEVEQLYHRCYRMGR